MLAVGIGSFLYGCGERQRLDFGTLTNDESPGLAQTSSSSTSFPPSGEAPPVEPTIPSVTPAGSATIAPTATTIAPTATTNPIPSEPVRGKVLDFWGQPVANLSLDVGGITAATAADGTFEAHQVPLVYDVSFVVRLDVEAVETYAWTYQELIDRTPVLYVYRGLPQRRATLRLQLPSLGGGTLPCGAMALDGRHGHEAFAIYQASTPVPVVWRGTDAIAMNVHSLFWEASDANCDVPTLFSGWQQYEVPLLPGDDETLTMADPADSLPVATSQISGTVYSEGEGAIQAALFLRFASGATLPVGRRALGAETSFAFAAPLVDDTTLIVAASRVAGTDYAVDYESYPSGAYSDIEIRLPEPPALVQPLDGAQLAPGAATFEWVSQNSVAMLVVSQAEGFTIQFLVTAQNRVQLPDLSHLGFSFEPGVPYNWGVETNRVAPTVDEWLESPFPLHPFSIDYDSPMGPEITSGAFSHSARRTVSFSSN